MAIFRPNPAALSETVAKTAAARAALAVSQAMSPKMVRDVQRVLEVGGLVSDVLGLNNIEDVASPLLGGLSLRQARAIHEQVRAARLARKNLWFVRILDENQPAGVYPQRAARTGGVASLIESRIGPALGSVAAGVAGAVNAVGGTAAVVQPGESTAVADAALSTFDLLALDVSYGPSLISDHQQVGSGFIDRPTGRNPTELQIVTMDDEVGSIKRWFEGKLAQVARPDGTFGLPWEYLVTLEVVHAIPSAQVPGYSLAYSSTTRLRPQSMQHDLSRRDQGLAEVALVLSQFDNFMGT